MKFNLLHPVAIAIGMCSALVVPAHADVTANTELDEIFIRTGSRNIKLVDIICNFRVTNSNYSPASVKVHSALVSTPPPMYPAGENLRDFSINARVDYYGFLPQYTVYDARPFEEYAVRDIIKNNDSNVILSNSTTGSFSVY